MSYTAFASELEKLASSTKAATNGAPAGAPKASRPQLPVQSWTADRVYELAKSLGVDCHGPAFARLAKGATGKEELAEMSPSELRVLAAVLVVRGRRAATRRREATPPSR